MDWSRVRTEGRPSDIYFSVTEACGGDFSLIVRPPPEWRGVAMLVMAMEMYRRYPSPARASLVRHLLCSSPTSVVDI